MKYPSRIYLLCLSFASSSAFADYQLEVNGMLESDEIKFATSGSLDTDTLEISGTYYLKPILTINNDPWQELAFLQKASWGSIGLVDIDEDSRSTLEDSTSAAFSGRYVLPGTAYFAETRFQVGDTDSIEIGLGHYLDDKTTVQGSYEVEGDYNSISASFKRVTSLASANIVSLDASVSRQELTKDDTALLLNGGAQYYLDRELSVGADLGFSMGDLDGYKFGINSKFFFTESFAISASYSFSDLEPEGREDREITAFNIALTGRF